MITRLIHIFILYLPILIYMNSVNSPNIETLWKSVLAEIQLQISKPVYKTCFANTSLLSLKKNTATIGCSNPMMTKLIEERYYSLVKSVIDNRVKKNTKLLFKTIPQKKLASDNAGPLFSTPINKPYQKTQQAAHRIGLGKEYTFKTFAVSTTNQMAYAAATAIAHDPGKAYNPLLLYGGVGVGKTHLMQAIGHAILNSNPQYKVVFCMGDEFTNEIIEGIQLKTTRQFKQKYRSAQLLLVDDIQFIAGKQAVQEEFFHTFNAIRRAGGQIVLTSDRPPSEISRLEERLKSRFEAGLIIDIGNPDFELRAAIANIKAEMLELSIPSDAIQLIASNIVSARGVEGFLRRLKSELLAKKVQLTYDFVSDLLGKNTAEKGALKNISPQKVIEAVALFYNLKKSQLKGPRRSRPIARPRQIIMYVCKTRLGMTLTEIGSILGGRDHTTIIHGVDTITKELSTNQQLREDIERINQKLWG